MAKRRANNEGSIFKDSRGYWVAEFVDPAGKKRRKSSKTQSVVRDWLQSTLAEVRKGAYVESNKITVAEFCERYMRDVVEINLQPTTCESYRFCIRKYIVPDIGNVRMDQLKTTQVQAMYRKHLDSGLSKRMVKHIHSILRSIINRAVVWRIVPYNVVAQATLPRPDPPEHNMLSTEQIQALLDVSRGHSHHPVYCIAVGCGLREGEVLGLRPMDIDIENRTIHTRQSVIVLKGKSHVRKKLKTTSSVRVVGMPDWLVKVIAPVVAQSSDPEELVFKSANGGPLTHNAIFYHFHRFLDAAGLPSVPFHSLRHSNITMLLADNVPPKDVQVHAGHATFQITMDIYGHAMPDYEKRIAPRLDGKFRV